MTITISVDVMGGDHGVSITVPACLDLLHEYPDTKLILVGDDLSIRKALRKVSQDFKNRISIISATEVISSDDSIEIALRKKKDSSMRIAIEQVKEHKADAVISAGNTGALMAISRYLLKTLHGIDRPAIATRMPNQKGTGTTVLDLGANSDCEAFHLLQFAQMADVMALKTREGLASMISQMIKEEFGRSLLTKFLAFLALPILLRFRKRVDHRAYNGAMLLGLRGLVIKSHGSADKFAFYVALVRAYEAAKNKMVENIEKVFETSSDNLITDGAQTDNLSASENVEIKS